MSEYKKMFEWHDEIGLVAGMKFESEFNEPLVISKFEMGDVYWIYSPEAISVWHFAEFNDNYKLIYDPRSENKSEKELKMSLADELRKNSEECKRNNLKESKEYKDFSSNLTKELINFSKNSPAKQKIYVCYMRDQKTEVDMLKLFCDENGLGLNGWTIVWE